MTTEQMDWLDDERAGRHAPLTIDNRQAVLDHIADLADDKMVQIRVDQLRAMVTGYDDMRTTTEKEADDNAKQARIAREDGVVDITRHSEDTLYKARDAIAKALPMAQSAVGDVITEILNAGILFREPAPDYDAVPADSDEATMAEEPIEQRLRRAWLNGFKEGVERASYSATESWGRWDS